MMMMIKGILFLAMAVRLTVSGAQNESPIPSVEESFVDSYREIAAESSNVKGKTSYGSEVGKPTAGRAFGKFDATLQSPGTDYFKGSFAKDLHLDPSGEEAEDRDVNHDQFYSGDVSPVRDVDINIKSDEQPRNIALTTVLEVEKYLKSHPELPALSREDIIRYIHNISGATEFDSEGNRNETAEGNFRNAKPENSKGGEESVMLIFPEKFDGGSDVENQRVIKTGDEEDKRHSEAREENIPEDEAVESFGRSQSTSERKVYGYPVYKAAKTESPSDTTARSYTNYDDPEMVTKSHNLERKNLQQPFNHKYDEVIAPDYESVGGLDSAIIVLPLKDNNRDVETDSEKDRDTVRERKTTLSPVYVTPANMLESFPEKQTTSESPLGELGSVHVPESPENVKIDGNAEVSTVKNPSVVETESKKKKFVKRKRIKSKTAAVKNSNDHSDLLKVVEILPEDMKGLLENLNLGNGTNVDEKVPPRVDAGRRSQPSIDPSSFSRFKPLPLARSWKDGYEKSFDDEMKEFLASFGLVPEDNVNGRRRQKSYVENGEMRYLDAVPQVNMEIIPEDMRHVIYNLGLANRQRKQSTDHIFNPSNHSVNQSREEMEKLKALMAVVKKIASFSDSEPVSAELQAQMSQRVKELDNFSVKYKSEQSSKMNDEIKQIIIKNREKFDFIPLRNFTEHRQERKELDLDLDPLLLAETSRVKNEVKRQASDSSGSGAAPAAAGDDLNSSAEPTKKEAANIEGLKESFGGGETASDDADIDSALPPKKPNGLYLLVDWNSFLEVGTEDNKRRVNIRFQPKIGDGRHFIPVTVP